MAENAGSETQLSGGGTRFVMMIHNGLANIYKLTLPFVQRIIGDENGFDSAC